MNRILVLFAIVSTSFAAAPARADGLNLTVTNVRNDQGQIIVLVFDDASAFENLRHRRSVAYAEIPAQAGSVSHLFDDLNAGPYAIFLFHEEDDDLDLAFEGDRLLEGVGASGAPNLEDNPDFAAASVMPGPVQVIMHYDE